MELRAAISARSGISRPSMRYDSDEETDVEEAVQLFLRAARRRVRGIRELAKAVAHVDRHVFMAWRDSSDMDVMHRVIRYNNPEAVKWLITHGFFAPPYMPKDGPYAHLAARLGYKTVLTVLIELRPIDFLYSRKEAAGDEFPVCPACVYEEKELLMSFKTMRKRELEDYKHRVKAGELNQERDDRLAREEGRQKKKSSMAHNHRMCNCPLVTAPDPPAKSPLDLAAENGHLGCVQIILERIVQPAYPTMVQESNFPLAVMAGSFAALDLLLREEEHNVVFKRYGVMDAILMALVLDRPRMLHHLLKEGDVAREEMFRGQNFFHILYTYNHCDEFVSFSAMERMTALLLGDGHNFRATFPLRTYPLYSLLHRARHVHSNDDLHHFLATLRLLLCAGADPNHDENAHEEKLRRKRGCHPQPEARPAHSSALHCLLESLDQTRGWAYNDPHIPHMLSDYLRVLTQYGVNLNQAGHMAMTEDEEGVRGTGLHFLARAGALYGVNRHVVRELLIAGADPGAKVDGRYPVNEFVRCLLRRVGGKACWSAEECSCCTCSFESMPSEEVPQDARAGSLESRGDMQSEPPSTPSSEFDFEAFLKGEETPKESKAKALAAQQQEQAKTEESVPSSSTCSCSSFTPPPSTPCSCSESCSCPTDVRPKTPSALTPTPPVWIPEGPPPPEDDELQIIQMDVDAFLLLFDRLPHAVQLDCLNCHMLDYPVPLYHKTAEALRRKIESRFRQMTFNPKSLMQTCSERIWDLCGRDASKINTDLDLGPWSPLVVPDPGPCWAAPYLEERDMCTTCGAPLETHLFLPSSYDEGKGARHQRGFLPRKPSVTSSSSSSCSTVGETASQGPCELVFMPASSPTPSSSLSMYGESKMALSSDVVVYSCDGAKSPHNVLDTIWDNGTIPSMSSCFADLPVQHTGIFSYHPCGNTARRFLAKCPYHHCASVIITHKRGKCAHRPCTRK